jgi:ArsR family transcriptional regulator, arsenate/arsenite/antimonite-responsive transcriptional repressor
MAQTYKIGSPDCRPPAGRRRCCAAAGEALEPEFFKALGDPSRLDVLLRLAERGAPATVSEVAGCCPVDLSVVSRHLAVLRRAGIVASRRRGREVHYRLLYSGLAATLRRMADAIEACCPPETPEDSGPPLIEEPPS